MCRLGSCLGWLQTPRRFAPHSLSLGSRSQSPGAPPDSVLRFQGHRIPGLPRTLVWSWTVNLLRNNSSQTHQLCFLYQANTVAVDAGRMSNWSTQVSAPSGADWNGVTQFSIVGISFVDFRIMFQVSIDILVAQIMVENLIHTGPL